MTPPDAYPRGDGAAPREAASRTVGATRPQAAAPPRCAACAAADLRPHLHVHHPDAPVAELDLRPTSDDYGTAIADLVRCAACGHVQLETFPAEEELEAAYASTETADYVSEEAGQRATARAILKRVEAVADGRRILDLGCWVGFLLAEAADRGWTATGVEPSAFAAGYARDRFRLDVRNEALLAADLEPGTFDAVFLGDVIEHLVDPAAALDRIATLLAPGGVLVMALPDAGSRLARRLGRRWWTVLPTHVQYFSRASMVALLRRRGYDPLLLDTQPKTFSVRYYLWRLEGYSPAVSRTATRVAELLGLADRLWTPDFRDRMLVIARTPS